MISRVGRETLADKIAKEMGPKFWWLDSFFDEMFQKLKNIEQWISDYLARVQPMTLEELEGILAKTRTEKLKFQEMRAAFEDVLTRYRESIENEDWGYARKEFEELAILLEAFPKRKIPRPIESMRSDLRWLDNNFIHIPNARQELQDLSEDVRSPKDKFFQHVAAGEWVKAREQMKLFCEVMSRRAKYDGGLETPWGTEANQIDIEELEAFVNNFHPEILRPEEVDPVKSYLADELFRLGVWRPIDINESSAERISGFEKWLAYWIPSWEVLVMLGADAGQNLPIERSKKTSEGSIILALGIENISFNEDFVMVEQEYLRDKYLEWTVPGPFLTEMLEYIEGTGSFHGDVIFRILSKFSRDDFQEVGLAMFLALLARRAQEREVDPSNCWMSSLADDEDGCPDFRVLSKSFGISSEDLTFTIGYVVEQIPNLSELSVEDGEAQVLELLRKLEVAS